MAAMNSGLDIHRLPKKHLDYPSVVMSPGALIRHIPEKTESYATTRPYSGVDALEPGDMIAVRRGDRVHTGIYIGDNEVVDWWESRVSVRPLVDFVIPCSGMVVVDFSDAYDKNVSVNLARWMAKEFEDERPADPKDGGYLFNQWFSTWCRTGSFTNILCHWNILCL